MKKPFNWHLLLTILAVSSISVFFTVQISAARPSQAPLDGLPSWPPGNTGAQGPQGPRGPNGITGNRGPNGQTGAKGDYSYAYCNWNG